MRSIILAFAMGIAWLQFQAELPSQWPWLLGAGMALGLGAVFLRRWRLAWGLAVVAAILAGIGYAAMRADWRLAESLPSAWEGRDIELVGVVSELPQPFERGTRFRLSVEQVLTAKAQVPSEIMLSWYSGRGEDEDSAGPAVLPGERWRLKVRLKRPHGNANPHAFDYEAWLLERGIRATGYVRPGEGHARLDEMVWRPLLLVERVRHGVREAFLQSLPEARYPYAGVLVALSIGDQRAIHGTLWNTFNRTGTTHLMSISGLHVTMLAALAAWLAGWGWRRIPALALRLPTRKVAVLVGMTAALLYTLIAGFSVPAQRTLFMLAVAGLALYSGRRLAPSRVLCLALLLVLLFDPWAVLAAGFWLSFGAVGALLYVGSARVDPALGWRARLREWGLVQWAATLASLPVLLFVFQQFSLVSPLANALAIPAISLVIAPLSLLAAVVPWWPLLELAHGLLSLLMAFLEMCADWPVWHAPAPPLWAALLAAVGVFCCLLPRGVPGRGVGLFLLLPALFWPAPRPDDRQAWIDVLDVGQGLAVVVRTRTHTLLYDTGPLYSAESDAGQRVIVPYLRAEGVNRLDMVLLTHRDADHSGGLGSVLAAMPVKRLLSSVSELGGEECLAGHSWEWDGVHFRLLHPTERDYRAAGKANHLSCVLRIEAGGRSVLLTSDIEMRDEAALLARSAVDLRADVLLAPHHGSRTSSSPAFIESVRPQEVIIPVGYRNRFGHPKDEVVARYAALPARIWRSDRDGAVRLRLADGSLSIDAWREIRRRYWQTR